MTEDIQPVDTGVLRKALLQLEDALRFMRAFPVADGEGISIHLRAGAIQAFAFTYEVAFSTIRRYVQRLAIAGERSNQASFNDTIRLAYRAEILRSELVEWQRFRRLRNLTSHTYDEPIAEEVVASIPLFIDEIQAVIERIDDAQRRA